MVREIRSPTLLEGKVLGPAVRLKFSFLDVEKLLYIKRTACEHKTGRQVTASNDYVCLHFKTIFSREIF